MRAILVEPEHRILSVIETDGKLESLQKLVDGYIEGIYPDVVEPALAGIHGYVDEAFLYSGKDQSRPWAVPGYPRLLGPGVFLCSTPDGEEADISMSLLKFSQYVQWMW